MTPKAIITDFDNTLVGDDLVVDEAVKTHIRRITDSGVIFAIATGRPYYGRISEVCRELELQNPIVVHGGAHMVNPRTGEVIWKEDIPATEVTGIIEFFQREELFFALECAGTVYTADGSRVPFYGADIEQKSVDQFPGEDVAKVIISARRARLNAQQADDLVKRLQDQYKDIFVIKIIKDGLYGLDITSARASKHLAVLEWLKHTHLTEPEVLGVGDGYNDYPLLSACGVKVAMGDAPHELKEIADYVAPAQKENGFLHVIEKYFPA